MATNRKKRSRHMRPVLTEARLEFLRTGETNDAEVFLDWAHGRDEGEAKAAWKALRDDYPPGAFPWAEEKFGGRR